jgi:hypothetical protein
MTKRQDLCLRQRSRPEQSDQRQPNQAANISHQPRASPNSTPLASRIEFPTTTAGSTFARDSLSVLRRFAELKPIGDPREKTLEESLDYRIELLPGEGNYAPNDRTPPELLRLPQIAMELMWPVDSRSQDVPPCAIMRWITVHGEIRTLIFGSARARRAHRHRSGGVVYDRYDALDVYSEARMFRARTVTRDALVDIAKALR